jgi:transposase InsO family protein
MAIVYWAMDLEHQREVAIKVLRPDLAASLGVQRFLREIAIAAGLHDDVGYARLEWVAWFNTQRLLEPLGYLPPAEYEEQFHRTQTAQAVAAVLN